MELDGNGFMQYTQNICLYNTFQTQGTRGVSLGIQFHGPHVNHTTMGLLQKHATPATMMFYHH